MSTDFESRAREILEQGTAKLDGRTLSRLTQARHAALAQAAKPPRPLWLRWMPAGAAAAAAVLAVMVWTGPAADRGPQLAQPAGGAAFEDIDLLADAPDLVSGGEDVEFYEWAAGETDS